MGKLSETAPSSGPGVHATGAARYEDLLRSVFGSGNAVREHQPLLIPALPPELELQSLWFSGAFGNRFVTTCGKTVEVLQFGHWNHSAGPDFTDTAVAIDGKTNKGAIELDPDLRDWERHGHSTNPEYDQVVLHLFVQRADDGREYFTRTSRHTQVPQVRLDLRALEAGVASHLPDAEAHLGRCSHPLREMPDHRVHTLLRSAARYRLQRKAGRIRLLTEAHGRQQALFQGVAEAFGYRRNRLPMTVLVQRTPLSDLLRADATDREAILFGTAGFLESNPFHEAPGDTRRYLVSLWESWWKRRADLLPDDDRRPKWNMAATRPNNHPHRRIGALAALASNWHAFFALCGDPRLFSEDKARAFFQSLHHEYWDHHYTLRADRMLRPMALVGTTRVHEILANVVFPMLIREEPDLWSAYAELPAKLGNEKLRRALSRLFGDDPRRNTFTRKVFQQQALLQIYQDFCLEDASACLDCPFPEQLRQWD